MKILITGGAGFVGANLAIFLSRRNCSVTCLDNLVRRGAEYNLKELSAYGVKFIHGDIRIKEDFKTLDPGGYDVLLNCAAQPSAINYSNPEFDYTNNTTGQVNVLEYCRETRTPIIFWSTNKVYPYRETNRYKYHKYGLRYSWDANQSEHKAGYSALGFNENLPISGPDHSIYGASKAAADILTQEWCNAYEIPGIINRFSCISGPRQWGKAEQGWVTWFAIANEFNLPLEIFGYDGLQVRDNLYIDDLCELIYKQINSINDYHGEVFNVGGGITPDHSLSLMEAIQIITNMRNKDFTEIKFHAKERRADQAIYISDTTKVRTEFDWTPEINVEKSYENIFTWIDKNKIKLKELYNAEN